MQLVLLLCCQQLFSQGNTIKKTLSYVKSTNEGESRMVSLLSNNTIWWTDGKMEWKPISMAGLPVQEEIIDFEVYQKIGMMSMETRYIVLLKNSSIWWFADGKDWSEISKKGLPEGKVIQDISPYSKNQTMGGQQTRIIAVCSDNSMYWFNGSEWQPLTTKGLPL